MDQPPRLRLAAIDSAIRKPCRAGTDITTVAARSAQMYESSMPGVFAVGDARHGSVKRVASAVGEGSVVIQQVLHYLTEMRQRTEPAR